MKDRSSVLLVLAALGVLLTFWGHADSHANSVVIVRPMRQVGKAKARLNEVFAGADARAQSNVQEFVTSCERKDFETATVSLLLLIKTPPRGFEQAQVFNGIIMGLEHDIIAG